MPVEEKLAPYYASSVAGSHNVPVRVRWQGGVIGNASTAYLLAGRASNL